MGSKRVSRRLRRCAVAALLSVGVSWGSAQLSDEAAAAFEEAQRAAVEARETYITPPSPDQRLWREAVQQGEAARRLAPDDLGVLRFLAQTYSTLSWDGRAWGAWENVVAAGGVLDADDVAQLIAAGRELGYARYLSGDLAGAEAIFARMLALDAENADSATWLGRIALERGESEVARGYWARVLELRPDDETARYYLGRSEQQLTYGAAASGAFNEGLAAYNAGQQEAALAAFERAAEANPEFEEARVWAIRVALELGRPRVAEGYARALLAGDPEHERARLFLEQVESQLSWGALAGRAYLEGEALYSQGEIEAAAERFAAASDANVQYLDAATWAARSYQETGQAARAAEYWERALALDPNDERARYFLQEARAQSGLSAPAVAAFNRGVRAYGVADPAASEAAFAEAVGHDPLYAEAWGWLGRLSFERGAYTEAADAYAQALELEPASETYRFFAGEAARLAGE